MSAQPHDLLVEDDPVLAEGIQQHLLARGFTLIHESRGDNGLDVACTQRFDLVLLDILLPGLNGLTALERLRTQSAAPVILMSALGAEQDRITGFTRGADDYLPKPFSLAELDARVDALLRRVSLERQRNINPPVAAPGLPHTDDQRQDIRLAGQWAELTHSEYRLFTTLLRHQDETLSKAYLYQEVFSRSYTRLDRGLDVHVCNLRRKLQRIHCQRVVIQSVWGKGYVARIQP